MLELEKSEISHLMNEIKNAFDHQTSLLRPVYDRLKLYLSEFIKRIEADDAPEVVQGLIELPRLNKFLEDMGDSWVPTG